MESRKTKTKAVTMFNRSKYEHGNETNEGSKLKLQHCIRSSMVYHWISHLSLVFSRHTHSPWARDFWKSPRCTTQKRCITNVFISSTLLQISAQDQRYS